MKIHFFLRLKATRVLVAFFFLTTLAGATGERQLGQTTNGITQQERTNITESILDSPALALNNPLYPCKHLAIALPEVCFVFDTVSVTLCPGESLTVGNHIYEQTGIYLDTLASLPCDTIRLTNLIVLDGVNTSAAIVNICSGGSTQLQAQGAQGYSWSPNTGLSATDIANPIASPSQTTTYTVSGIFETENLITNGDFEQGNTGFISSYTHSPTDIGPQAVYALTNNVINVHPLAAPCTDHTSGTGNLMAVNGAGTPNTTVWQQTVNVKPQNDYIFSAWVTNWSSIQTNLSNLQFSVNGQLLGNVFQPLPQQCQWKQFYIIWNSGTATSAVIRLVNQNLTVGGNDFGLDDIHFSRLCSNTDTVKIVVHQPVVQSIAPTICQGETFTVGSNIYNQSGSYTNTLQTVYGCDSTVLTSLTVLPVFQTSQSPIICQGESVTVGGNTYAASGTYSDVLQTASGCDSTVTTLLTVNPVFQMEQSPVICEGESLTVGASVYSASGTYTVVLQTASGCDSIVTTALAVLPTFSVDQSLTLCEGESVTVGNQVYTQAGIYLDTLQSISGNGCDSILTTSIVVYPTASIQQTLSICQGEILTVGGSIYDQSGSYADILQTMNGCDSIVFTNLTVYPVFQMGQSPVICQGDSITVGSSTYSVSGTYLDVLQTSNGCDSIVTTNLDVLPAYQFAQAPVICEGESVTPAAIPTPIVVFTRMFCKQ
ncbi:MAG: hypothetical protein IPM82_20585 [Saprospiraceae bacterium]|nr:hypothetical protein [Saprospiraceae bacterium]